MSILDWLVMLAVLLGIVGYGIFQTRKVDNVKSYLLGDKDLAWWTIGLSIMATQASAITFLSVPGKAFEDGMGFAQFYFGMPIAMVLLCIFVLPIYYRLNVYTAYEYLEGRFDAKTRVLTALLFLLQRGLAAGITIYAPSIILSNIMDWDLNATIFFIGAIVIIYTVIGGTKAVSVTQKQQMIVILSGMFFAAVYLVFQLPDDISFSNAVNVAGKLDKLEVVNFEFDLSNRYTFWTGMIGGVFLFLSYFGTDQSQVQRYLSGRSLAQSRLGLLFNGIIKVPMQFLILFVGVLVFIFFQFTQAPLHFNQANLQKLEGTPSEIQYQALEEEYVGVFEEKQVAIRSLIDAIDSKDAANISAQQATVNRLIDREQELRNNTKQLIITEAPDTETKDSDYVFISFITNYLPKGLIGLLLAVIFSAAMSSTASELNALATTTVVDIYRRFLVTDGTDKHYLNASKALTVFWGLVALAFAATASLFDSLIEAVNIIGSLFYGTILGVFVVAFFLKKIRGTTVFIAALLAEVSVINIYIYSDIAYLWLNLIGCLLVMGFSLILHIFLGKEKKLVQA